MATHHCKQLFDILKGKKFPIKTSIIFASTSKILHTIDPDIPDFKMISRPSGHSKPNINLVEVHPQLGNNRHPVDGALVGASSLWLDGELNALSHTAQAQKCYNNTKNIAARHCKGTNEIKRWPLQHVRQVSFWPEWV